MDDFDYLQRFFCIKPHKVLGPNFMCIELIIHVRAALNFDYITFSFPNWVNSNFEILRKSACSRDSKAKKAVEDLKSYLQIYPLYVPWEKFETLIYVRNKSIDGFNAKSQPWIKSFCS